MNYECSLEHLRNYMRMEKSLLKTGSVKYK